MTVGFEAHVFDAITGVKLGVVPHLAGVKFEDVHSGLGAGIIEVPGDVPAALFAKDNTIRVAWDNEFRFAFRAEMVHDVVVDDEDEDEGNIRRRQVSGPHIGQALAEAIVYPAGMGTASPQTVRTFTNVSRAAIVRTLFLEAQARGCLVGFTLDWTATLDSNGNAWADVNTLEVAAGKSLLELIEEYAALGYEWQVTAAGVLRMAPQLGVVRTSTVIVQPGGAVRKQATLTNRRDLKTVVLAEDQNGGVSEVSDGAALATWGRREAYVRAADAIDASTRANYGYGLLQLWKNEVNERGVKIATDREGRRPFIDFGLGDTIGAEFDGVIFGFRVLAIAMSSVEDEETCEVTLDALHKPRETAGTSGSTTVGTDLTSLVFAETTVPTVIGTSTVNFLFLAIEAFSDTYGKAGFGLTGTVSTAAKITVEVIRNGSIVRTYKHELAAGHGTIAVPFILPSIEAGDADYYLRASVSAGTFTVAAFDGQFWIEGKYLSGGLGGGSPEITVVDTVDGYYDDVTTTAALTLQAPVPVVATPTEVDGYYDDVTTTIGGTTGTPELIVTVPVAAGADNGMTTDIPSFVPGGTNVVVGNDGGAVCGAWYRFVLPTSLAGRTVSLARLSGFGDEVTVGALSQLSAADEAAAANPANRADFLARARTTATVNWDAATGSAVLLTSPDLKTIVQELIDSYGASLTSILVFHADRGSSLNGKMSLRTKENVANQPPTLEIRVLG